MQFLQGTVQSTSIGGPPLTDQTVNSSVADASIFTDAYRLGHPAVEVLAQAPLLHVQSGHSEVLHQGSSCAPMGPHTCKGGGIRWLSETNTTDIHIARQCRGEPQYGYMSWDNVVQIGIAPPNTKNNVVVIP